MFMDIPQKPDHFPGVGKMISLFIKHQFFTVFF